MVVEEVKDKYNLVYIVYYMIGVSTHTSKNFFTTATDYWMYKFRDPSQDNTVLNVTVVDGITRPHGRTDLQAEFISSFAVIANAVNYLFVAIAMIFGRKLNVEKQIVVTILIMLLCFVLTMVLVDINTDTWQRQFLIIQLTIGGLLTAAGGVLTVNSFQISVKFPPRYLVACMAGHSVCGIVSAIVQIFCLGMSDLGSQVVAFAYFSIGLVFTVMTLLGFLGIKYKSAFYRYHSTKEIKPKKHPDEKKEHFFKRVKTVLSNIKWYLIGLYLTTAATVIVEPGVTSLIVSEGYGRGNKWNDIFFVPVTTFFMFHFFDWLGRESGSRIQRPKDGRIISLLAILRIALVPLFMYCNLHPRYNLPVIFKHDYIFMIFIIILAFSTGYCSILTIFHAGRKTPPEDKSISSNLTLLFLMMGVLSFSFFNILVVKLL